MDFGGFIGRFHPLVVHLPIGFLLVAALFEYYARKRKYERLDRAIEITLFLGAAFAIIACLSGWLLANRGAYLGRSLFLHRWLGISVAVLASIAWLVKTKRLSLSRTFFNATLGVMVLGLFAAGHFGGNMTHGDDYLVEYAPAFVKNMLGFGKAEPSLALHGPPDSIQVYDQLIQPALEDKCFKCHRPDNNLGGLDMTSKEAFLRGGDSGAALHAGAAYDSEVFERIVLPVSDRKSMPPSGLPLSFQQTRLIEWWINSGASFEQSLAETEVPKDIQNLLEENYGISLKQQRAVERIEVAAADPASIKALINNGINISNLSETSNLLEVTLQSGENLSALDAIKNQVTWLNLENTALTDAQAQQLSDFHHLTRLRLQGNPISDNSLNALANLEFLESVNLNRTSITDAATDAITQMKSLRRIYLFETAVSPEAISQLENDRPDLEIVQGFQFSKNKE